MRCSRAPSHERVTLAKTAAETGEPIGLAVLPDRGVLHTSRDGVIRYTNANGDTKVAANLPVYSHDEDGLQAIAIDPGFATNNWVYVYYSPPLSTPGGDAPFNGTAAQFAPFNGENHLSRFKWNPATETIDLATQQTLLEVDQNRGICCHNGGDFAWDAAGNLYLSTGDDTNPFESDGYSPIDERSTRNPAFDAQRSSANTNDLRGKVLRIKPDPVTATYTIPAGNLFAPGEANTRPEIYAMGFRNPFRISVDKDTGHVYVGDYGPDAGGPSATRGPGGQVEYSVLRAPGNYGWPYCTGDTGPTNLVLQDAPAGDWTVETTVKVPLVMCCRQAGLIVHDSDDDYVKFDVIADGDRARFELRSETGDVVAQPETSEWLPYPEDDTYQLRLIKTGDTYNAAFRVTGGEWNTFDTPVANTAVAGAPVGLFALGIFQDEPIYAAFQSFDITGDETDPGAPIVQGFADPATGDAPLTVQFSAAAIDRDGAIVRYRWDFDDDGSGAFGSGPVHTYTSPGTYQAKVTATDRGNASATATVPITVTGPSGARSQPPDAGRVAGETETRAGVRVTRRHKLARVVRHGLRYTVACETACRVTSVLRSADRRLGRLAGRVAAVDSRRLVLRLDRSARRRLGGERRIRARLVTTIRTAAETRVVRRTVVLRR